ncbi:PspC domain-containing protein [Trueperella pyogenes]|uniref:ATP-binding protein n=1 Tax=Trueperella pyogenes TaxID=1661 RepID=UPI002169F8F6|nr:ATP-binding protein [Trueperella pyogenes]UVJ54588.1 PspC domain-containing protein [Trueperella pyogenes]
MTYTDLLAPWATEHPELLRREPKVLAGVCRGLATHLGGSVKVWRWGVALLSWTILVPVLYIVLAMVLPRAGVDARKRRLVKPLATGTQPRATIAVMLGVFSVLAVLAMIGGVFPLTQWVLPIVLVLIGGAIAWSVQGRWANLALAVGLLVAGMGGVIAIGNLSGGSHLKTAVGAGLAVLATVAFVTYPSQMRSRIYAEEQKAQLIREETRADIAAHLHDSVLQTLALIRSRADDADAVRLLARQQEAELRDYLYSDRGDETSVAAVLTRRARDIEATYGAEIDVVITGDTQISAKTQAVIDAAGEALTNACKHGSSPISVYAELGEGIDVWVRDRGEGFDMGAIGEDRRGIRHSIYGRMERVGGHVNVRSPLPSGGTEVHIGVSSDDKREK